MSFITSFSYCHIWSQSSVVYIHEDNHQSYRHKDHFLYTDRIWCHSHCLGSVVHRLQGITHKIRIDLRNYRNIHIVRHRIFSSSSEYNNEA